MHKTHNKGSFGYKKLTLAKFFRIFWLELLFDLKQLSTVILRMTGKKPVNINFLEPVTYSPLVPRESHLLLQTTLAVSIATFVVFGFARASSVTTIGTNIDTAGSLTVAGNMNAADTLYVDSINDRVGVGTSSPYAKFAVAGQVVGEFFTATSTSNASTFPLASTTALTSVNAFLGTVRSGAWNGSTITVAYGGTGLSSAPAYGQLLIGTAGGGYALTATSTLNINTDNTTEGLSNLFFTSQRARNVLSVASLPLAYSTSTGQLSISAANGSTNGYLTSGDWNIFNNKVASSSLSSSATGLTYTPASGIFSLTAGYNIPLTASTTEWTSGRIATANSPLTFSGNTVSITQATSLTDGYLNVADWNMFNQKIGSSTITGLTAGYLPSWNGSIFINSTIFDNGNIGIGTDTPYAKLSVAGQAVAEYFTATSSSATSTFPSLDATQSSLGMVIAGTWQGGAIGSAYGGTGLTSFVQGQTLVASDNNVWQATSTLTILSNGFLGIGTSSPQATLDVDGYARLRKYSSQPIACSGTNDGALAMTSSGTLCTCIDPAWMQTASTTQACVW